MPSADTARSGRYPRNGLQAARARRWRPVSTRLPAQSIAHRPDTPRVGGGGMGQLETHLQVLLETDWQVLRHFEGDTRRVGFRSSSLTLPCSYPRAAGRVNELVSVS